MRETKNIWIILAILALLVLIGLYTVSNPQTDVPATSDGDLNSVSGDSAENDTSSEDTNKKRVVELEQGVLSRETFVVNNTEYALERFVNDQRIVSTIGTRRTILVPSVRNALPGLGNLVLSIFSVRKNSPLVVFVSAPAVTHSPFANLYRFDVQTRSFTSLFTSRFLPYRLASDETAWLASDRTKFLSLRDRAQPLFNEARNLYLVDLSLDQARSVLTVREGIGETLTQSLGIGDEPIGAYRWLGNTQIEYSVFNADSIMPRVPLAVRTLNINLDQK